MDPPRGNILKGHGHDVKPLYVKVATIGAEEPVFKARELVELVDTGDAGLGHLPSTAEAPFERANVWAIVSAAPEAPLHWVVGSVKIWPG